MDLINIPKSRGIYKLKNKINNKIYIGKSVNLYKRISSHRNPRGHENYHLRNAILKYGVDNFEVEILYTDKEIHNNILLFLETSLIYDLNTISNGYNICLFSHDCTGRKLTQKHKEKLSKFKHNLGKKFSDSWRLALSKSKIGKSNVKKFKSILQIDKNTNNIIKIWPSIKDAANELRINRPNIIMCCRNKRNEAGGFKWKYN